MSSTEAEELLFVNGRVYASAHATPSPALLIRGTRVIATGSESELRRLAGRSPRVIELAGSAITPGFTDAHVHLTAWALVRRQVDLSGTDSIGEAVRRAAAAHPDATGWIRGHGWNAHLWDRLPTRGDLDRAISSRPVFLDSQDLHAAWLNGEALRHCGIERDTPDPVGGRIVRDDETGNPTGLLLEAARALARDRVPAVPATEVQQALLDAQREAHRLGITGVHSVEPSGLHDFSMLAERSALRLRVLQHVQLDQLQAAAAVGLRSGFGGDWIRVGGVKMFLDGALGSRTAWLRAPYEGSDKERGIQTLSETDFREATRFAAASGLPSTVHAIGDAAVELALRVLRETPAPGLIPHRIEHAQLCPVDLVALAERTGIVASMQPVHLLTDVPAAERHWGPLRAAGAYPFRPLLRAGVVLAFGSDVPVETIDPRPGLFAATRRTSWRDFHGDLPAAAEWHPAHSLRPSQAVAAYTEGPAVAAGSPGQRGRLLPGYDADLCVWSIDPVTADPEEYRSMECLMTVIDGNIVFDQGLE